MESVCVAFVSFFRFVQLSLTHMEYKQANKKTHKTTKNINWSCSDNYDCIANCHIYLLDHQTTAAGIALHYITLHCIASHWSECRLIFECRDMLLICQNVLIWFELNYCLFTFINKSSCCRINTNWSATVCVRAMLVWRWPCHLTDFESNA